MGSLSVTGCAGSVGRLELVTIGGALGLWNVTGWAGSARRLELVTIGGALGPRNVTGWAGSVARLELVTIGAALGPRNVTGCVEGDGHGRRSSVPSAASRPARRVARASSDADHRSRSSASIRRSQMLRRAHGFDLS